jgi:hypothetical protein
VLRIAGFAKPVVVLIPVAIPVGFTLVTDGDFTDDTVLMVPATRLDVVAAHDGVPGSEHFTLPLPGA